jgi:hypothetical protein
VSKKRIDRIIARPAGIAEMPKPKQDRYIPKPCTMCTAWRPNQAENYTEVTRTMQESEMTIRYCRCRFCGFTWKTIDTVNGKAM